MSNFREFLNEGSGKTINKDLSKMKLLDTFTNAGNNVADIYMHDSGKKFTVLINFAATKHYPEETKEYTYNNMESAYSNRWVKRILKGRVDTNKIKNATSQDLMKMLSGK
jgi:hypothetical protein